MLRLLLAVSISLLAPHTHANNLFPKKLIEQYGQQSLLGHSLDFTAEEFFSAYTSKNHQDRKYAEAYLLGVLEATEGITWCGYRVWKSITIEEHIYTLFKALPENQKKSRASTVIVNDLKKNLPCNAKGKQ